MGSAISLFTSSDDNQTHPVSFQGLYPNLGCKFEGLDWLHPGSALVKYKIFVQMLIWLGEDLIKFFQHGAFFYSCDSADSRSIKVRSILHSQYLLKQRWKPRCLTDSRKVDTANGIKTVLVELLERSQEAFTGVRSANIGRGMTLCWSLWFNNSNPNSLLNL